MALNYLKSGKSLHTPVPQGETVLPGRPWIFGTQLGVTLDGGTGPKLIAVALRGIWELPCEGDAFEAGEPLNFSIPNQALYTGTPAVSDFTNVAIAASDGGGSLETCRAKINAHMGTLIT